MTIQNAIGRDGGATFDQYWGLPPILPGGRLSLTTTAISNSTDSGTNTLNYVPFASNFVPYWSAKREAWGFRTFATMSTLLSGVSSGTIYDVFLSYNEVTDVGVLVWYAWTNNTTRNPANAPTFDNGYLVRNGNPTDLWLGSFRGFGSNLTVDSPQYRLLFNAHNRVSKLVRKFEASSSAWTRVTTGWDNWFNTTNNRVGVLNGLLAGELIFKVTFNARIFPPTTGTWGGVIGTGLDVASPSDPTTTTSATGLALLPSGLKEYFMAAVTNNAAIALGYHFIQAMARSESTTVQYTAFNQCGLEGVWEC